jgi:predicted nucleic acid-binding protein
MRANVLADFFIGAQASAEGWPILTRDTRRYRTYFPNVDLLGAEG